MLDIRVRMNHSHTAKDGWKLSDDTVEITLTGIPQEAFTAAAFSQAAMNAIEVFKRDVYTLGVRIAQERNEGPHNAIGMGGGH